MKSNMGSGGGLGTQFSEKTRGGGAVLISSQVFEILGNISASGYPQNLTDAGIGSNVSVSGGSGGLIMIDQMNKTENITINKTNVFSSVFHAIGGKGQNNGNGGSGGRIIFNVEQENPLQDSMAFTYGGVNPQNEQKQQYCLNGAPGTIYFTRSKTLQVKGFA